jgi:ATP-dependent RNA helicase RhlE
MGFIHDIRKIVAALPSERQSLFFSATMSRDVIALAETLVRNPARVAIAPEQPTVDRIAQKVLFVEKKNKVALLTTLLRDPAVNKVLVFTRLKHTANRVAEKLGAAGISGAAIHGNKSQQARTRALTGFKAGKVRVLVATDIAARGIDVDGITHVINYDLPNEPATYVHRIGRTARAGASGDAISFCSAEERGFLRDIERLIKTSVPPDTGHAYHNEAASKSSIRTQPVPQHRPARTEPRRFDGVRRRRRARPATGHRRSVVPARPGGEDAGTARAPAARDG